MVDLTYRPDVRSYEMSLSCFSSVFLQDGKGFSVGELVWGKLTGMSMWPGLVMPWKSKHAPPGMRRVEWFGDGMFSEVKSAATSFNF